MRHSLPSIFRNIIYIILAVFVVISPIAVLNIFLSKEKGAIEEFASTLCRQNISVGGIRFLPPNNIIMRNIFFDSMLTFDNEPPFFINELKLSFSLKKLILDKEFYIAKITINHPKVDLSDYVIFNLDIKRIISALKEALRNKKLRIVLENGVIILPFPNSSLHPVVLGAAVDIDEKGNISSRGNLSFARRGMYNSTNKGDSGFGNLGYKLKARLNRESVDIDDLEIVNADIYTKLLGKINKNTLIMGGMVAHNSIVRGYKGSFIDKLKNLFYGNRYAAFDVIGPSFYALNIYDLSTKIEFSKHGMAIKYVKFSLNNIPFCLKGYFSFSNKIGIDLSFSSYPDIRSSMNNNSKKIDFNCSATYSSGKFDGSIVLSFFKSAQINNIHHKIDLKLRNLSFAFPGSGNVRIKCLRADVNYTAGDNTHIIFLKDFNSSCDVSDKKIKIFNFTSRIYDGFLKGKGYLDVERMPFRSSCIMKIGGVSAQNLRNITEYFDKIHGNLSSFLKYRNHPYSHLYGDFTIENGYLDNIMFFKWLAGFFNLPALKELHFSKLSGKFSVDDDASRLENIDLKSDNVALKGNFTVSADDMVSSKLYLTFSGKLLDTSAKFKRLLKLLGKENAKLVNFDFQLSGLFNAMNFQWLESDFKERLRELLPPMVERILERRIGKVVESISGR